MRCLVTGAAGFVGSTLVDALLARGEEVIGIDSFVDYYPRADKERNLKQARAQERFSFVEGDLNLLDLPQLLEGVDYIFHQAAQAGVRASWGSYFETYTLNNVNATQKLLEAARQNPGVKKIVYASSSSVYGNAEQFPTHESLRPLPVSPYGVTKLAAENLMMLYASEYGVPTVSLRYFTVYGPRQRPEMAFHRFIRAGLTDQVIELYGDGTQSRDFTYIDDIVAANLAAAERGAHGAVYNIGGGAVITVNEVLSLLEKLIGPLHIRRMERQRGDASHTSADTEAAQAALGYRPAVTVETGLQREIAWLQSLVSA